MKLSLLGTCALLAAAPAIAQDPLAPLPTAPAPAAPLAADPATAPPLAPPVVRMPRDWRETFAAIRSGNWAAAAAGIQALPRGPLTPVAFRHPPHEPVSFEAPQRGVDLPDV